MNSSQLHVHEKNRAFTVVFYLIFFFGDEIIRPSFVGVFFSINLEMFGSRH